ncbi:MAG: hypothetical protein OEY87_03065 [Gammaproteobacteria bacterium]|nr:hypothetical protein [Gammaproteobacteria bacterium]MDH5735082.1 hypothetical protein [Gammaproteobacteria bacterium]
MKNLVIKVVLPLLISTSALADTMYPVITYTCDTAADVIKIKNEVKWNEEGKAVSYADGDEIAVFNPWDWVSIEDRPPRKLIRENKIIEKSCQLSSGLFKVLLRPHIFNVDALAKCGDQISVRVTVLRGGSILLDSQPMQEFCHGNSPIIRGIKIAGESGDIKIVNVPRHKFF